MTQNPRRGMHPEESKSALRMRYGPITHLAVSWGLSRTVITHVLHDPQSSTRVERMIAKALGMKLHDIWPDRWDWRGVRLPRSARPKSTRTDPATTSQKRQAV